MHVRSQYGNNSVHQSWSNWYNVPLGKLKTISFTQSGNNANSVVKYGDDFYATYSPYISYNQQLIIILIQRTNTDMYALYFMIGYQPGTARSRIIPISTNEDVFNISQYQTDKSKYLFKILSTVSGYTVTLCTIGTGNVGDASFFDYIEMIPYEEPTT